MFNVEIKRGNLYEDVILKDTESGVTAVVTPEKGGMLTSIVKDNREYIYKDEKIYSGQATGRCANPVLFPTVGRTKDEILTFDGKQYKMGIHGIVKESKWQILSYDNSKSASVTIYIKSDENTKNSYPFDFEVRLTYSLVGSCVSIYQEYINCSDKVMPFSFGFHPYFCVSDVENLKFDIEAQNLLDVSSGDGVLKDFTKQIDYELIYGIGAIYTGVKDRVSFADTVDNTGVILKFDSNFKYIVVWSNKRDKFICVEPWSSIPNSLNTGVDVCRLNPNEALKAQYSIEIK